MLSLVFWLLIMYICSFFDIFSSKPLIYYVTYRMVLDDPNKYMHILASCPSYFSSSIPSISIRRAKRPLTNVVHTYCISPVIFVFVNQRNVRNPTRPLI